MKTLVLFLALSSQAYAYDDYQNDDSFSQVNRDHQEYLYEQQQLTNQQSYQYQQNLRYQQQQYEQQLRPYPVKPIQPVYPVFGGYR